MKPLNLSLEARNGADLLGSLARLALKVTFSFRAVSLFILVGFFFRYHWIELSTAFIEAPGDRGDSRYLAWVLEHGWQSFLGAQNWRSPSVFFPKTGTLGYSDALAFLVPIYGFFRTIGLDIFVSAIAMIFVSSALNMVSALVFFVRVLKLDWNAAFIGTLVFCLNSPKFQQWGHWQLQPVFLVPMIASGGVLWWQGRWKWGLAFSGVCLGLQFITSFYLAWFFAFFLLVWGAVVVIFFPQTFRFLRRRLQSTISDRKGTAVSCLLVVLSFLPFFWIYLPVLKEIPQRDYNEVFPMVPRLHSWAWMGEGNLIWSSLIRWIPFHELAFHWEHRIGIGLILSVSWILILHLSWRRRAQLPGALKAAIVMLLAINLIALKYPGLGSPWYLVYKFVPGAKGIRAVTRYVLVWLLPFSVVVGWYWQNYLVARVGSAFHRDLFTAFALLLIGLEQAGTVSRYSIKEEAKRMRTLEVEIEQKLKGCRSFYAYPGGTQISPWDLQVDAMILSVKSGYPTLNGYSGVTPPGWDLWNISNAQNAAERSRIWVEKNGDRHEPCLFEINR